MNYLVYPSVGILLGLLFVGAVWEILMQKKDKVQQDAVLGNNLIVPRSRYNPMIIVV